MKIVYVSRQWRSIRTWSSSKRIILFLSALLILLLTYAVFRSNNRTSLPLIDYTGTWQSDPGLMNYIRMALLWPPSWQAYKLSDIDKEDFSRFGQSKELAEILHMKEGGYFIEAGSGDGENGSTSLYFERTLEWQGLLIEEDFVKYLNLTQIKRQSSSIHAKLSTTRTVTLREMWYNTSMEIEPYEATWELPLYSLMLAMELTHIDLLILDTIGTELEVLQTLPWDEVKINVLCIAYTHMRDTPRALTEYLRRQGYTLMKSHIKDMFFASNVFLGIPP